jgi:hypothetical protein
VTPIVLDTGALIGLERRDPRLVALADEIVRRRIPTAIPAGVVAQAWRGSPRQHAVSRLLGSRCVLIHPLDDITAFRVGALLARQGGSDVTDGHVALLAGRLRATVYTSDPADIRVLDPTLTVVPL